MIRSPCGLGPQEYVLHTGAGAAEMARLIWDESLPSLLRAVRLPGREHELVQQFGDRLLRFWAQTSSEELEHLRHHGVVTGGYFHACPLEFP